ncbi:hypothetical protein [Halomonas piscis]|nr:hypothetical protein [Halomonas piscis]
MVQKKSAIAASSQGSAPLNHSKALAETAALLALSKKAEAIWGTTNDEDD